jgi:formate hydrogenlyase subunit 3/multisubunit Na+/H+ antiporter MnhD subunit
VDQFSPAELTELYFIRESVIDAQFQFWITITFAVIAANFVAGKRLSLRSRSAIALLYALAVVVLVSRWYFVAVEATQFRQQLNDLGIMLNFPWATAISRIVLVALGTAASLIFLLSDWLRDDPDNASRRHD